MTVDQILKDLSIKLESSVIFFEDELATIHTGRASVNLVDTIPVDIYGSKQTIKQIASITVPESRQILIQPWDKGVTGQIESAIRNSNLGFSPVNNGDSVRVIIPELTEERRKNITKVAKEKAEEAKVSVRTSRTESWNLTKRLKTDGIIGEDEMYRGEHRIQEQVDKTNHKIEEILTKKEKELMEI